MTTEKTETMTQKHDDDRDEPRTNQLMRRGFDGVSMMGENAATQALVAKATADIQARWIMAMRCPRDMNQVRQAMIKECKRPGFAKTALYHVPRGGGMIHGLSIRFAEVAMRCFGNMSCEAQTLFDSPTERVIRVIATDFESNVTWPRDITVKKTVERKQLKTGQRPLGERVNSYSERVYIVEATDDDVATKEAAAISKASRTAILRLIPGHIQDEMREICTEIAKDEAAKDPDAARNRLFDAFATLNIMPLDIEQWLGHPVDKSTSAEYQELGALHAAIRDREVSWAEAMEAAEERRSQAAKKPNGAKPAATTPTAPATATAPAGKPAAPEKKTGGRGAQNVKEQMSKPAEKPPSDGVIESRQKETAGSVETKTIAEPAPDIKPAPAAAPSGPEVDDTDLEERNCAGCQVPIEVAKTEPDGAKCYACRMS